jgi:hypothetical protein
MDSAEVIVVDSTKGGKFYATVRKDARGKQLQGSMCCVDVDAQGRGQRVLCQIGMVDTINPIHENPAFGPLIMADGFVKHFSKEADIEKTTLDPLACIDVETGRASGRKANPCSGTPGFIATNKDLEMFRNEREYFMNAGYQPGYPDATMSIVCRHYGDFLKGGHGEAKHRVVFGQNGSGKTVLEAQHIAGRLVRHRGVMGALIPDTKGDFVVDNKHDRGDYKFSFLSLLRAADVVPKIIASDQIRLKSAWLLKNLLASHLASDINSTVDKATGFFNNVIEELNEGREEIPDGAPWMSWEVILGKAVELAPEAWSDKKAGAEKTKILEKIRGYVSKKESVWQRGILPYFTGKYTTEGIARMVTQDHRVVILDLVDGRCSRKHQDEIMLDLFRTLSWVAKTVYRCQDGTEKPVNAEIVLDEAPRWVPEGERSKEEPARTIIDATNTTRAYGLSWTYISQRIASINKSVFSQCHTKWFGRNIGVGVDRSHMKDELGESGLAIYDQLQLQDAKFFLGIGEEVNIGAGRAPVAMIGWDGNATQKIMDMNPHIWKRRGDFEWARP